MFKMQVKSLCYKNFEPLKKVSEDGKISHACGLLGLTQYKMAEKESHLQIQQNFYKNSNTIIYRPWKDDSQVHIKKQTNKETG